MRDSEAAEAERRLELVVGGEQRSGGVEHRHASILELAQLGETGFDTVEGRVDVEATQNDVSGPGLESGARPNPLRLLPPAAKRLEQQGIRERWPVGEEEEHNP